ncbi:MAG: hypothetical protein O3C10_00280 [Chloroflexi bacterium]|nr:hypothetical protein [Chloroflexota bacterium]
MSSNLMGRPLTSSVRSAVSRRLIGTLALAVLFTLAFLVFTLARVARHDILDAGFYTDALEENRVYDRFYEDVLSDPELADIANDLFGDVEVERSFAVSTLRLIVPPSTLQEAAERVIADLLAYLRGETQRFETVVELTDAIGLQGPALSEYYQERFAVTPGDPGAADNLEEVAESVARDLVEGRIPESMPVGPVPPEAVESVADALLAPINDQVTDELKRQVVAALTVADIRTAIAIAAPVLLGPQLAEADARLREFLGDEGRVDPVAVLSDLSDRTEDDLLVPLNSLRDVLRILFGGWLSFGTIVVMLAAAAAMVFWSPSVKAGVRTLGITLTVVGASVLVMAWLVGPEAISKALGAPVDQATDPDAGLPDSVAIILQDVAESLLDELSDTVRGAALFLLVPGVLTLGASFVWHRRVEFLARQPSWERAMEAALTASVLVVAVVVFDVVTPERAVVAEVPRCNGHADLCDRPYDRVVFPATHNSMSSASLGWFLPSHDRDIPGQLEDGVRALLIDTHYWTGARDAADALVARADLDAATAEALGELIGGLGDGLPGAWLCHATCWLGATNFTDTLIEIRAFMDEHPREVVTLIVQDGVNVEDTSAAFEASGLTSFLHEQPPGTPWPTLGAMINSGRRLIVLSENSGTPPAWNHPAFELMQETPFEVDSIDAFTCEESRGPSTASLFQMNHWVVKASPDRVDAVRANDFDFLLARARRCESERGQLPNFIPVNFSTLGDLFEVVDELNGVR